MEDLPKEDHFEPKFTPNQEYVEKFIAINIKIDSYFQDNLIEENELAYEDKTVAFNNLKKMSDHIHTFNSELKKLLTKPAGLGLALSDN